MKIQDLALGLVEPQTIGLSSLIQPVQIPPALQQIHTPAQLGVICEFIEGALHPLVLNIYIDIKQDWLQYLGKHHLRPTGFNSSHDHTLGSVTEPVFHREKSVPVQATSREFLQGNALGNSAKRLTEI